MGELLYRAVLALSVGAIGAGLALWLNMPLAMLIGPLVATLVAALAGVKLAIPLPFRQSAVVLVAVSLSSKFSPDILGHMAIWPFSLMAVLPFVVAAAWPVDRYYRKYAGFDRVTSLMSAIPGGLQTMITVGPELGGDESRIVLAQVLRLMLSVVVISAVLGVSVGITRSQMAIFHSDLAVDWSMLALVIGLAFAGYRIGRWLKLPTPQFIGVMPVLAPLYLSGTVAQGIPGPLLAICLWIVGSAIGSRFSGFRPREVIRLSGHSVVAVLIMLAVCLLFAGGLWLGLGLPYLSLVLAFAPGGIVEMSLIALALDVDPGFVSVHHLVRIGLCTLSLPVVFRILGRRP